MAIMQTIAAAPLPTFAEILEANPAWLDEAIDTAEASRIAGPAEASLETLRTRGGGPVYFKVGSAVRYTRRACFEWRAERQRRSTSDRGQAA